MAFDLSALGEWTEERDFKVEPAQAVAYAAATNDNNAAHAGGRLAPPVFAVVPTWEAMRSAAKLVTPPEARLRVVHGEQDIRVHRPIVPGEVLRSRAAPLGVRVKPSGTTLLIKSETADEAGELVNEQWFTMFYRGVADGESGGQAPPDHRLDDAAKARGAIAQVTYPVDLDQTFRYADASGDHMPIHLDDNVARSVGLPGIIVHGLCTMAFTGRAVLELACGGDPARLRRLAVRFSKPVLPGDALTVSLYPLGPAGPVRAYGFEATNPAGEPVVKDGLAEVGSAP